MEHRTISEILWLSYFFYILPNARICLSFIKDVEGLFIETSAKEGDNILEAVTELARSVTIRCSNQLSTQLNKNNKFDGEV